MTENEISRVVVDSCFKLHNEPGPGLPESVYEATLCYELTNLKLGPLVNFNVALIKDGIKRIVNNL